MEIWRDITGYEGCYQVSNLGRVRSVARKTNGIVVRSRIKACSRHSAKKGSYLSMQLYKNNKSKNVYVHRLVAEAFIPNPEEKETVNHKNGNKHDNRVDNLEWCTYAENNRHAYVTGLNDSKHRRNCKGSFPVAQYKKGKLVQKYPSIREASRQTGIDNRSIGLAIKTGWKFGGFEWRLLNQAPSGVLFFCKGEP